MGTNYYWHEEKKCTHCGHDAGRKLHIGKSSVGWYFSLRVYEGDEGPANLDAWQALWASGGEIQNEYGEIVAPSEMLHVITQRSHRRDVLPFGYSSWAEFHRRNLSEDGVNDLVRCDMRRDAGCIGHGDGTWSMFNREFS